MGRLGVFALAPAYSMRPALDFNNIVPIFMLACVMVVKGLQLYSAQVLQDPFGCFRGHVLGSLTAARGGGSILLLSLAAPCARVVRLARLSSATHYREQGNKKGKSFSNTKTHTHRHRNSTRAEGWDFRDCQKCRNIKK